MSMVRDPDFPAWRTANWRQRTLLIVLNGVLWGIVFPAMVVGALVVLGMTIDGVSERRENLAACQKHAETPFEYHQCR